MRCAATLAVPLTGVALISCPVAQATQAPTTGDAEGSGRSVFQQVFPGTEMIATGHNVCNNIQSNPTTAGVVAARDSIVNAGIFSQTRSAPDPICRHLRLLS